MGFYGSNDPTNSIKALKEDLGRMTGKRTHPNEHRNRHQLQQNGQRAVTNHLSGYGLVQRQGGVQEGAVH